MEIVSITGIEAKTNLLPCPLCGGKARLEKHKDYPVPYTDIETTMYRVVCGDCHIQTPPCITENAISQAVEIWNQRWEK